MTQLVGFPDPKIFADIPRGMWVALSNDQSRVVAYADELEEAMNAAREAGQADYVVTRVPVIEPFLLTFKFKIPNL